MSSSARRSFVVAAVMVAFDTTRSPARQSALLLSAVDYLIIVDNTPQGHPQLPASGLEGRLTVHQNFNAGALAGAYNTALALIRERYGDVTHVLFVDDDTDTSTLAAFLDAESIEHLAWDPTVAAIAPLYIDRATGLPGAHIQLTRLRFKVLPRVPDSFVAVSFLINSMSLWRLDAINRIGTFSRQLGLDHIDTDYCLRATLLGYQLILDPAHTFLHSIGQRRSYRFLGQTLQAGGHSPNRRRLIARNTMLLAKHYGFRLPAFAFLCIVRLGYELLGICMAENERRAKLTGVLAGAFEGLLTGYEC